MKKSKNASNPLHYWVHIRVTLQSSCLHTQDKTLIWSLSSSRTNLCSIQLSKPQPSEETVLLHQQIRARCKTECQYLDLKVFQVKILPLKVDQLAKLSVLTLSKTPTSKCIRVFKVSSMLLSVWSLILAWAERCKICALTNDASLRSKPLCFDFATLAHDKIDSN